MKFHYQLTLIGIIKKYGMDIINVESLLYIT